MLDTHTGGQASGAPPLLLRSPPKAGGARAPASYSKLRGGLLPGRKLRERAPRPTGHGSRFQQTFRAKGADEGGNEPADLAKRGIVPDLRYAARTMLRNPALCVLALLSLALGIGANTVIYSFMDSILLRTLPVASPESLVLLNWHSKEPAGIPPNHVMHG